MKEPEFVLGRLFFLSVMPPYFKLLVSSLFPTPNGGIYIFSMATLNLKREGILTVKFKVAADSWAKCAVRPHLFSIKHVNNYHITAILGSPQGNWSGDTGGTKICRCSCLLYKMA